MNVILKETKDGFEFVATNNNKYLVTYEIDGEMCEPTIETANEIFRKMEMSDCYDITIRDLRWLKLHKSYEEFCHEWSPYPSCIFTGLWCNRNPVTGKNDPLRMEIRQKFGDMELLDVGYAEEH